MKNFIRLLITFATTLLGKITPFVRRYIRPTQLVLEVIKAIVEGSKENVNDAISKLNIDQKILEGLRFAFSVLYPKRVNEKMSLEDALEEIVLILSELSREHRNAVMAKVVTIANRDKVKKIYGNDFDDSTIDTIAQLTFIANKNSTQKELSRLVIVEEDKPAPFNPARSSRKKSEPAKKKTHRKNR